jgi:hypothetical protein
MVYLSLTLLLALVIGACQECTSGPATVTPAPVPPVARVVSDTDVAAAVVDNLDRLHWDSKPNLVTATCASVVGPRKSRPSAASAATLAADPPVRDNARCDFRVSASPVQVQDQTVWRIYAPREQRNKRGKSLSAGTALSSAPPHCVEHTCPLTGASSHRRGGTNVSKHTAAVLITSNAGTYFYAAACP